VELLGIRDDVPDLMRAADGYVMSSAWEGLPLVLLEAAATSLPIVATDVGGNATVVMDETSGFIVPPGSPEALAAAMQRLQDTPASQRQAMGQAGRAHVIATYDLEAVLDTWERLYRDALVRKGAARVVGR
jgi:glycosyltransferase involved in cell wall biosynthesis